MSKPTWLWRVRETWIDGMAVVWTLVGCVGEWHCFGTREFFPSTERSIAVTHWFGRAVSLDTDVDSDGVYDCRWHGTWRRPIQGCSLPVAWTCDLDNDGRDETVWGGRAEWLGPDLFFIDRDGDGVWESWFETQNTSEALRFVQDSMRSGS